MVYQTLHHFCSIDMSSFYLDIVKDRQYTMAANSHGRRSAQTAMYLITEALVRWIAPVLSFTSDEIWQHLKTVHGDDRSNNVFTETYVDTLFAIDNDAAISKADWQSIQSVRSGVSKSLETLRAAGTIGAALEASVTVYASGKLGTALAKLGDELRFVFITSTATVLPLDGKPAEAEVITVDGESFAVAATTANGEKCVRCWHRREDVGANTSHPELCGRCVSNIDDNGEQRNIA